MRIVVTTVGLPFNEELAERESNSQEQGRQREVELPDGARVRDAMAQVDGAAEQVQKVLVNGSDAEVDQVLEDGDAVSFVGQTSGD
ncbi:MAG: MoaD/ThiS family protein [Chloroflexota bacterium]